MMQAMSKIKKVSEIEAKPRLSTHLLSPERCSPDPSQTYVQHERELTPEPAQEPVRALTPEPLRELTPEPEPSQILQHLRRSLPNENSPTNLQVSKPTEP
jgi:hypothetical protein